MVPSTVAPAAPLWPPPPSTRHTALASTRGPVRSDSFTRPGFSSRSVIPQSVPCTSAARLLSSSTSDSAAPSSRHSARGMDITTTRPLSYSSMSATIRASMASRTGDFVRNSALFTGPTSMPRSISAAAMRCVRAVVLA